MVWHLSCDVECKNVLRCAGALIQTRKGKPPPSHAPTCGEYSRAIPAGIVSSLRANSMIGYCRPAPKREAIALRTMVGGIVRLENLWLTSLYGGDSLRITAAATGPAAEMTDKDR